MISEVKLLLLYGLRFYLTEGLTRSLVAIAHAIRDMLATLKFCRIGIQRFSESLGVVL